jgi:hypothetical protein
LSDPIDISEGDASIRESKEEQMSENENDAPATAVAEPTAKKAKAKKTKKAKKPKAKAKKTKSKAKKTAKHRVKGKKGKKVAVREQTCVNLPVALKVKLDAKCRKVGKSRNRILNELAAKFCGFKLSTKARVA